ncbi:retrovirus-related pol polyprotein from transposon TNT 1-94 [Tanacetum coccineum]
MNIIVNSYVDNTYVNVRECEKCLKLETELLNKKDLVEKEIYDKLFRSYTTLEKHCISLEIDTQLNQEIFQKDNFVSNQSAPSFDQYFELNELKAHSQEKDTVMKKSSGTRFGHYSSSMDELKELKGKSYHIRMEMKRRKSESESQDSKSELDRYLNEDFEDELDKFDILNWWKVNNLRFPVLSLLARDVLAIPISMVVSESVFSTGGRVLDTFRSSLTYPVVESLIFT